MPAGWEGVARSSPLPGVLRLRRDPPGVPPLPAYGLACEPPPDPGDGAFRVELDADGALRVARDDATALLDGATVTARPGVRGLAHELRVPLLEGDGCYGWGEHALPPERRGQRLESWNTDHPFYDPGPAPLYGTYPLLLVLRGGLAHGLYWNDPHRTLLDLTGEAALLRSEGGGLDLFVLAGPQPADVLEAFTALTGRPPLRPRWALGLHQSHWGWRSSDEVRAVSQGYAERGIPLDALYLDIDHMSGYRTFTFDPDRYGDGEALVRELHRQGTRVVTIADPGLKADPGFELDAELLHLGLAVERQGAPAVGEVWPGPCHFADYTDPAARAWWADRVAEWQARTGVDGVWCDMNEPAVQHGGQDGTLPDDARHDLDGTGGDHRTAHNLYGLLMAQATYEGLARSGGRPFVLSRAGFAGIQRSAHIWTGDNCASWEHLRLALWMVVSAGLVGVPFCGADLGGFAGDPEPELYVRFLQLGALLPLMRIHSARDTAPREPWRFGSEVEGLAREAIELRHRLLPYLYTLAEHASRTGEPLLRPAWWSAPGDQELRAADEAALLGADVFAVPALRRGQRRVRAPLPPGRWRAAADGQVHERGVLCDAPLDRLPLLHRCGAVVPLGPEPALRVDIDPAGGPLSGSWYDDDGESLAYRDGAFRRVRASGSAGPAAVTLELQHEGTYRREGGTLRVELHGLARAPASVVVDGEPVRARYGRGVLTLETPTFVRLDVSV